MNIYLVGFMGSGKSTVGKILSKKLGLNFIDIDKSIEEKHKKKIKEIFQEYGESYFRQLEKKEIEEISKLDGYIVSTGGGLGADKDNMKKMKKTGKVIWLDVSLEEVLRRCKNDKDRPLLQQPIDNLKSLFNERKNIYSFADIHIKVDNKTPEEIAEEIIGNIRRN